MTIEGRCPGEDICDRFTGVAGDTWDEKCEEACTGCLLQCKFPIEPGTKTKDGIISQDYANFVISTIEDLALEARLGNLKTSECQVWEWELVKYWIKTEKLFERQIQITDKNNLTLLASR